MIIWKLREVMEQKGWKGKDLANRVGKHPNTIYRMRDAEEMPPVDGKLLNELCNTLDCTLDELVKYVPDSQKAHESNTSDPERSVTPTAAVVAAAAVGATQAMGSSDPSLAAKVAASVMHVFELLEEERLERVE